MTGNKDQIRQMERLVKGLESRVARQRIALVDSESQLAAAQDLLSQANGQPSLPLVKK